MTEQPADPTTEQQWLGNTRPAAYLPGGHRIQARPAGMLFDGRSPLVVKFLDVVDDAFDKADGDLKARRATDAGLRRLDQDVAAAVAAMPRRTTLEQQAEVAASHAVTALSSGELDEGIAWLQSALAFAQNHRHATRHEEAAQ
jgi:hypothetical protein